MKSMIWIALFIFGSPWALAEQTLEVLSENGSPLSGATILIGHAPGDPFEGNQFTTNSEGIAAVPAQWKTSLPITIRANNHVTATYIDAMPVTRRFMLSRTELADFLELSGTTDGFGRLRRDGKLDVGLVMPTFSRQDLLSFDISSVISPQTDTISVAGRSFDVPSNITFPEQRERYFIPFTLNKPDYRAYSRKTGPQQFIASHAQFPVKRVIDKIRRGDSILTTINDFTFKGGGLITADLQTGRTSRDISVNEFSYDDTLIVQGPSLPDDKIMLSIAVNENNGLMFPTDLKFVESEFEEELKTFDNGRDRFIASMLTNRPQNDVIVVERANMPIPLTQALLRVFEKTQAGEKDKEIKTESMAQMSIVIQDENQQGQAPNFLDLVPRPEVTADVLRVTPPASARGVIPATTLFVYSSIETIQNGSVSIEKRTRLWQASEAGWSRSVRLPDIDLASDSTHTRWEVIYLGIDQNRLMEEGLDDITHITRNSLDIQ